MKLIHHENFGETNNVDSIMVPPLQRDLANELRDNEAEQDRVQGTPLVYGDTIQVGLHSTVPCSFVIPGMPRYICGKNFIKSHDKGSGLDSISVAVQ